MQSTAYSRDLHGAEVFWWHKLEGKVTTKVLGRHLQSASDTSFSMQIFLQWQKPVALELHRDDHVETLKQAVQVTSGLCRLCHSSMCTR